MGIAPTEDSSGDKKGKQIIDSSDLCRIALWQWIFCLLEIRRNRPTKNDIDRYLGKVVDAEKATAKPVSLVRMRVAAKAVRLLFKELVNEMT